MADPETGREQRCPHSSEDRGNCPMCLTSDLEAARRERDKALKRVDALEGMIYDETSPIYKRLRDALSQAQEGR